MEGRKSHSASGFGPREGAEVGELEVAHPGQHGVYSTLPQSCLSSSEGAGSVSDAGVAWAGTVLQGQWDKPGAVAGPDHPPVAVAPPQMS